MNRNPIKQWAITFPQSGDVARKEFADSFPPAVEVVCAQEKHADGGNHLHLGIKLKKGISKSKLLNWIEVKWPNDYLRINIQPTRDTTNWGDYCMKEDPDCYTVKVLKSKKKRYTEADAMNDVQNDLMEEILLRKEFEKKQRFLVNAYEDCVLGEDDIKFRYRISKPEYVLENIM